jgi:hypothetical protein
LTTTHTSTSFYNNLTVYSSSFYEGALKPVVEGVTWRPTGEKSVVVNVTGRNFFTNTQVKLGDTIYSEDNKNLIIKSEQSIDVITTFDQLASGPSSILGRYGLSVPLFAKNPLDLPEPIRQGFQIERGFKIGPAIDGYRTLEIMLGQRFGNTTAYSAVYQTTKESIDKLTRKLSQLKTDISDKQSELVAKQGDLDRLKIAKKPDINQQNKLQSEIQALESNLKQAQIEEKTTNTALADKKWELTQDSSLGRDALLESQPPIVSVNGTALKMPYAFSDVPADREKLTPGYVKIQTTFQDNLITKGAALIQVSWPFYDPARWTDTLQFADPDDQFKVDRVSADTIVIRRETIDGFVPGTGDDKCWTFVAGATSIPLYTKDCKPKPTPKPANAKPAPKPDAGPPIQNAKNVTSVTLKFFPTPAQSDLLDHVLT